jgi:phosphate/sulfate permease
MVVVLAQSLVLFIFSSTGLSNLFIRIGLPPIPMVPVSSSQVIVGCVIGIGLYKGVRNINFRLLGEIALGWIATPIMSGLLTFFSLFFIKNIFNIEVGHKNIVGAQTTDLSTISADAHTSEMIKYLLLGIIIIGILAITFYLLLERKKNREIRLSEEKFWKNMK